MPNVMQQLFIMNMESLLKEYAAYKTFNKTITIFGQIGKKEANYNCYDKDGSY